MPNNFQELIKKSMQKKAEERKAAHKKGVLFGSGITKKAAQKANVDQKHVREELSKANTEKFFSLDKAAKQTHHTDTLDVPIIPVKLQSNITLDEYQQAALTGLRKQKYGCLIGAAGTGKTTVLKQLVAELEASIPTIDLNKAKTNIAADAKPDLNVAICFCAFTGRAVQQMKRALPKVYHPMCNTVHATLGYMPESEEVLDDDGTWRERLVFRPTFTSVNKLPYKVCIVDEAGMLPINLWDELFAALPSDCRIILVGDINQLPPVQGRSVLGFAMTNWPTFALEKIHRQAEDNPIIANAHNILRGFFPKADSKKFIMRQMPDGSVKTLHEALNVVKFLHQKNIFDPMTDALIVPQNEGTIGQVHINDKLVHYFNPEKKDETGAILNKRQIISAGYVHVIFAVGDKVMLLQNDRERGLTNGMTGVVVDLKVNGLYDGDRSAHSQSIDSFDGELDLTDFDKHIGEAKKEKEENDDVNQRQASHVMTVEFTVGDHVEEVKFSTAGQFKKIAHAYAFTCHKSQGGEYPTVVILLHSANATMLNREWLYTAVTRAQERVILLYNDRGLAQAVNIQRIKGKSVEEKAKAFLELQDKKDTRVPNLPEPKEI